MNPERFFEQLDERGKVMGVRFGPQPMMSNSRIALQGGEFAKEHGKYDAYHEAVFRAFFTDCKDIGDQTVLLDLAERAGLEADALDEKLNANAYLPHLEAVTAKAQANGFSAAPTFVIDGYGAVSGAQPIDTFRSILQGLGKATTRKASVAKG